MPRNEDQRSLLQLSATTVNKYILKKIKVSSFDCFSIISKCKIILSLWALQKLVGAWILILSSVQSCFTELSAMV